MPLLVRASVTLNGRKFHTYIHEGASAEQLIEKIAKENGGGVARVYYPEHDSHEIVAVKIGSQLLVKGDPKRVSEGDFSQFEDADFVRSAAISASYSSKGGIHLFVGSDGIPMAVLENEELVFPNAEELRVSSNINNISLSVVEYNADPLTLGDLNGMYREGTWISEAAHEEIKTAHGDDRAHKIELPDTSVLILGRETGEIKTASELGSRIRAEGFAYRTEYSLTAITVPKHAQQVQPGLILPTDLGPMHIPLDGSSYRVPYLYVKLFDGKVSDEVKVVVYHQDTKPESPREPKTREMEMPVKTRPSRILKTAERPREVVLPIKTPKAKLLFPDIPHIPKIRAYAMPLPEPKLEVRKRLRHPKAAKKPERARPKELRKRQPAIPAQPVKAQETKLRGGKKPKPKKDTLLKVPLPKRRKKKRKTLKKPAKRKEGQKKKALPKDRLRKPKTFRKKPKKFRTSLKAPKTDRLKPKKDKKAMAAPRRPRKKPKKDLLKESRKKTRAKKKRNLQSKRKKIHPYYFNAMMGLYRPRRGRTRAGSSGRRRRASRT